MKKLSVLFLIVCILSSLFTAYAEPRTIDLSTMTVNEIDALIQDAKDERNAATDFDSSIKRKLESEFEAIFESYFSSDVEISYPLFGLDGSRERECYQLSGDCTVKYNDGTKVKYKDVRAIFWHDEAKDEYSLAAFMSKDEVFFTDADVCPNIARYLDENTFSRVSTVLVDKNLLVETSSTEPSVPTQELTAIPAATDTPTEAPTPAPTPVPTATPTPTEDPTSYVIKRGDNNEDVRNLQKRLIALGYLTGSADGDFGPKTEKAVIAYQKAAGLPQTGECDYYTYKSLTSSNAPVAPKPTATVKPAKKSSSSSSSSSSSGGGGGSYIGNKNTKKFHHSWCSSVGQMKSSNKVSFSSSSAAKSKGYVPCKKCNP